MRLQILIKSHFDFQSIELHGNENMNLSLTKSYHFSLKNNHLYLAQKISVNFGHLCQKFANNYFIEFVQKALMAFTLQGSRTARFGTLCTLYFSQGIPWFFVATALVTYLVDKNAMTDDEKLVLLSMGMLPWIIGKLFLGPLIDRIQFRTMGRRRPWVLISQLGMAVTIATFLLIDDPAEDLKMLGLFFLIHNIFASLQDVSADALAVEVLPEGEIPLANGLMFVAKGFGAMFAVLVLGGILLDSGFQSALLVQLPVLS